MAMILVNNGGQCEFCGLDVTGRDPEDACPENLDSWGAMHSTAGYVPGKRPGLPLAPIKDEVRRPRLFDGGSTVGGLEIWGATTTDDLWLLEREEAEDGTPWYGYHRPSVADGSYTGEVISGSTLRQLRIMIATGYADEALKECKAKKAGNARAAS